MSIRLKTPQEIEAIAAAGAVAARVLEETAALVRPGLRTAELNEFADTLCRDLGAVPTFIGFAGYRHAICVCPNDVVAHGIPSDYLIEDGDIVGIDFAATLDGYVADTATTVAVGEVAASAATLLQATEEALAAGIAACTIDSRLGDIGAAVSAVAHSYEVGVVEELAGHGVGFHLHEEPLVRNVGKRGHGLHLQEGMVLAIEPMFASGSPAVIGGDDGWTLMTRDGSLSAVFEHTIAVTADGPRLLSVRSS